jgi:protein-tyrosine-phosphatase
MAPSGELPRSVLFVCTSNALRSPMAAGLMRRRFGPMMRVESAGVRPGAAIDAMTVYVMDEFGVDLARHRPQSLEDVAEEAEGVRYDVIVTLSPEAHHHALGLVPILADNAEYWPTIDPSLSEGSREQRLMEYRQVRDGLDRRIAERFPRPSTG